jgi:SAM-dependent methyltransferase
VDIRGYNSRAWDRQVADGNRWTVPVDPAVIAAARAGDWSIILTPTAAVPRDWFPAKKSCDVLCLASGGGQQAPVLAAAGMRVTVLDNSPAQLAQDRLVAEREGLPIAIREGDMAELGVFGDATFDLIVHPVSNCFVPDVHPVWREAFRVLRPGGVLLAGMMHPAYYIFDFEKLAAGELVVRFTLPYADTASLDAATLAYYRQEGTPMEFSHTLEDLIAGQLAAGFLLTGFYEDRFAPEEDCLVSRHMPTTFATRAVKPESG